MDIGFWKRVYGEGHAGRITPTEIAGAYGYGIDTLRRVEMGLVLAGGFGEAVSKVPVIGNGGRSVGRRIYGGGRETYVLGRTAGIGIHIHGGDTGLARYQDRPPYRIRGTARIISIYSYLIGPRRSISMRKRSRTGRTYRISGAIAIVPYKGSRICIADILNSYGVRRTSPRQRRNVKSHRYILRLKDHINGVFMHTPAGMLDRQIRPPLSKRSIRMYLRGIGESSKGYSIIPKVPSIDTSPTGTIPPIRKCHRKSRRRVAWDDAILDCIL